MLKNITLLAALAFTVFTSCGEIDRNVDAPRIQVEIFAKGDLPLSAEQRVVTFVGKNGSTQEVYLGSSLLVFADCGTSWCPIGNDNARDAETYAVVDCNGGTVEVTIPAQNSTTLAYNYDETSKSMWFDNVNNDVDTRVWASHNVKFDVVQEGQDMLLSCTDCPGVYEGFEYTERHVRMRSFR